MKSTFVITLKCLVLTALIAVGCTVSEIVNFSIDFSGTKSVEFAYREDTGNISESGDPIEYESAASIIPINYIDSAFQLIEHVSNLNIDTSDLEVAIISYDFEAPGPIIKDQKKYNNIVNKMPGEFRWYFKHRPNTFRAINKNQLLWKAIDKDIAKLDSIGRETLLEDIKEADAITTLHFAKAIKTLSSNNIVLSDDRKTIETTIHLKEVVEQKRENDIMITFE